MEVSREIILVGPQLLIFESKNRKLLEIDSFFASLYLFRKLANNKFWGKILETFGDALRDVRSAYYKLLGSKWNQVAT